MDQMLKLDELEQLVSEFVVLQSDINEKHKKYKSLENAKDEIAKDMEKLNNQSNSNNSADYNLMMVLLCDMATSLINQHKDLKNLEIIKLEVASQIQNVGDDFI